MALTGTGLPIEKSAPATIQPGTVVAPIHADQYSNAQSWQSIAQSGAKLAEASGDVVLKDARQAQIGYLADQDVEIARSRADLRDKFANDPTGFDNAWTAYRDGKLGEAQPWAVPHIKATLGSEGNSAYTSILNEKRAQDVRLDSQKITALTNLTGNDVVGAAMAGTLDSPDGQIKIGKYRAVLDSAVSANLMPKEAADFHFDDTMSKAQGEIAARDGVNVYREKGFDAAVEHLKSSILENEGLSLKGESRYKAFNRGLTAVRLASAQDKEDRGSAIESSKDLRARITSNQPYDEGEVRDTLAYLGKTGAAAEFQRLSVAHATAQATAPYRSGLKLGEFANAVDGMRGAVVPPTAKPAMDFFVGKGWSPAAAAGIVGNLMQESSRLDPSQSHDDGTGIGIAGWRLERRQALQQFAAARGKPENDFQTQLEFIDHELRTSEAGVGEQLKSAATAKDAASAFINFERPAGWTPDNPAGGHGYNNRVRNAQTLAGEQPTSGDLVGVPYAGEVTKRVQGEFVNQARKAWPDFKTKLDQGKVLDDADFDAVRYAAGLSGDANWQQQVEQYATAQGISRRAAGLPASLKQSVTDAAREQLGTAVSEQLQKQFDRERKMTAEDPVGLALERGRAAPAPLDLANPQAATAAVNERVGIARAVSQQQETPPGNPFRPAETAALAGAIGGGDPARASSAYSALAGLPDEFLIPALGNADIKDAVTGAARSADPARFNATMQFMDRIWARAPEAAKSIFGEEAVHALMTWQTNTRYMTPDQQAKQREQMVLDPQVRDRMRKNEAEGAKLAGQYSFDDVVKQFDNSWWLTPGPIARLTGSQPLAPTDAMTRDTMMGDFANLYARRYAETLDKDKAAQQATEMLKTKWSASPLNGGRLMLNAPETLRGPDGKLVYPPINGSWDWAEQQIQGDLRKELGEPLKFTVGESGIEQQGGATWPYRLVSDRQTQAEAQAGKPASYVVVVPDKDGRETVLPRRFRFDPTEAQQKSEGDFAQQRARILQARENQGLPIGVGGI